MIQSNKFIVFLTLLCIISINGADDLKYRCKAFATHAYDATVHSCIAAASIPIHLTAGVVGGLVTSPAKAINSNQKGRSDQFKKDLKGIYKKPCEGLANGFVGACASGVMAKKAGQQAGKEIKEAKRVLEQRKPQQQHGQVRSLNTFSASTSTSKSPPSSSSSSSSTPSQNRSERNAELQHQRYGIFRDQRFTLDGHAKFISHELGIAKQRKKKGVV